MATNSNPPLQPGRQPTPAELAEFQRKFQEEAAKRGLSPQEFGQHIRAQQLAQQQAQQQQAQSGQQQQQQAQQQQHQHQHQRNMSDGRTPVGQAGAPTSEGLAVANFLKSQPLKSRTVVLQEKRKDMFKVKRAIRALTSPAYIKARTKNPLLPEVTDRASAENIFKLLPSSMLAIRVARDSDSPNPPHGAPGHVHGAEDDDDDDESGKKKKQKTKKGKDGKPLPWDVHIVQHQECADHMHYVWFHITTWEKWYQRLVAAAALMAVIAVVCFPLWPLMLRQGVWYLSMACLGVLAAFFGLAMVRLVIFVVTVSVGPAPGLWIYPNLFEDVGFFDSFRPGWEWRETKESAAAKKAEKKAKKIAKRNKKAGIAPAADVDGNEKTTFAVGGDGTESTGAEVGGGGTATKRNLKARVEEVEDE